jgi:hypothetical protein
MEAFFSEEFTAIFKWSIYLTICNAGFHIADTQESSLRQRSCSLVLLHLGVLHTYFCDDFLEHYNVMF